MEIKLNRKKLYDDIWNSSLFLVSVQYRIPEEKLINICKEMNIPIPDDEYWKNYYFGDGKIEVPKLMPYDEKEDFIVDVSISHVKKKNINYDDYLFYFDEKEKKEIIDLCESIDVNTKIDKYHDVVNIIMEEHKKIDLRNKKSYSPVISETNPNVRKRIYRILHLIFTNIEKLGYKVKYDKWIKIIILNEEVNVRIREKSSVIYIDDNGFGSRDGKRRELMPNSLLELSIFNSYDSRDRVYLDPIKEAWFDNRSALLEDVIGDFIIEILYCGTKRIIDRKNREEKILSKRKEAEILEKKIKIQKEERRKLEELENKAYNYDRAMRIRKYIELFSKNDNLTDEDRAYMKWALEKADWIDPTIKKDDPILDERLPDKVDYSYYYGDYFW